VTRRRRRSERFGGNRQHFINVTFRIRFAVARAGRADCVRRPPALDAMVVRQEAAPPGLPRITALPSFRTYDRGAVFGAAFIVAGGMAGLGSAPETGGAGGAAAGTALMGRRRERRRRGDRIAATLAVWLSRFGMDRDAELLDRLAARARWERYREEEIAERRRD
jgi:hypothetical protein